MYLPEALGSTMFCMLSYAAMSFVYKISERERPKIDRHTTVRPGALSRLAERESAEMDGADWVGVYHARRWVRWRSHHCTVDIS